jgi:DNA-binding beta-propeller fold protein YncE
VLALVMLVAGAVIAWYALNRKPLTELPGTRVVTLPTYKTSFYDIEAPLGVAVTPDGGTVFATHGGQTPGVTMFDRDGRHVRELDLPADGKYHVPVYLTVAPNGNLYVGDRIAGEVYIYGAGGDYIERFIPQDAGLTFSPLGLAVAKDGTLYVADVASDKPEEHRILVFDRNGLLVRTLGEGELNYPNELVLDGDALYATDGNNGRLIVFDAEGTRSTLVSTGVGSGDLGLPRGLGLDDRGRIFVVDSTDHMIRMYTKGAQLTDHPEFAGAIGDVGIDDGKFMFPNGLAVDARARIYITDRQNNRIQVWGF